MRTRRMIGALVATTTALVTVTVTAGGALAGPGQSELAKVRAATARYHDVSTAGPTYQPFLPCMDSAAGGMGRHYVDFTAVGDPGERATHPEALVYADTGQGLKLAAVEYIVPAGEVDPSNLPQLFGQTFHEVNVPGAGDLFVLHVWIWKPNPRGIFQDYNPSVAPCPSGSMP